MDRFFETLGYIYEKIVVGVKDGKMIGKWEVVGGICFFFWIKLELGVWEGFELNKYIFGGA